MEVSPINLMASFLISIIVTILLMFFVFVSTVYDIVGAFILIMLAIMTFFLCTITQYQLFYGNYPVQTIVFEKRANGTVVVPDRAKTMKGEHGKRAYVLKTHNIITKPINFGYIYSGKGGTSWLFLYMPQANELQPLTLEEASSMAAKLTLTPEAARYWYSEQARRNFDRWGKKFGIEKYAGIIQLVAVGFIIAFMLYIFVGQMGTVVGQIGGITTAQTELMKEITELIKYLHPAVLPNGIPPPVIPA